MSTWYWDDGEEFFEQTPAEVDDILERWLNGEDVSDFEDDGTIAEIKEDVDGLE